MKELPAKRRAPRILASSVAVLLGLLAPQAAQADQYWNGSVTSGSTAIPGQGGTGTWDNNPANTNWTNGTVNTAYDPAQTAVFATTPGVVTLGDNVTISGMTFQVDGYSIEGGAVPFMITPNGVVNVNAAGAAVRVLIDAQITGAGGLNLNGPGTVTLTNVANNFSGGVTLNSGRLNANGNPADGTGSPLGSGTLTIKGGTLGTTLEVTDTTNSSGTIIANAISVLGDFSIATNVEANPANAGRQNITLSGPIDLNGGGNPSTIRTITGVTNQGQVHFGAGGIGLAGEVAGVTFTTAFGAQGQYVAFILDANNTNNYTGLTTVKNGAFLVFQGATPNGAIKGDVDIEGNGVVDYLAGSGSQISDTATVTVNSIGNNIGSDLTSYFAGLDLYTSTTGETIGTLKGSGIISLGAATLTINDGNFTGQIFDGYHVVRDPITGQITSYITGGGLAKIGAGTLILSGANFYTGATTVSAGTLQAGAAGTFSASSAVTVNTGATLDLNSFDQTIASLADGAGGGGTVKLGSATLNTGGNNTNTTFSGVIQDSGSAGNIVKRGTGTFTLSGANTYSGITYVRNGTLQAGVVNTIPLNSQVWVDPGATFNLNNLSQSIGSLSDGLNPDGLDPNVVGPGTVNLGSATLTTGNDNFNSVYSGNILGGTGNVVKVGTGTFFLGGTNTYTGGTTVNNGSLQLFGSLVSPVVDNGKDFQILAGGSVNTPAAAAAVTLNNNGATFSSAGAVVGGVAGVVVTGSNAVVTNLGGGSINATTAVDLTTATAGQTVVTNGGTMTGTGGTAINGAGSAETLRVTNYGTINGNVTFGAANDTMVVSTGSVLNGVANGGAGSNTLSLAGGGTDSTNLSNYLNFSTLNKVGGGTWTVTGDHTFTGGTTISGGTLIIPGNLTSAVQIQAAGTLAGTGSITGNVSNAGTVSPGTANNPGTFTVKGNYFQAGGGTLVVKVGGTSPGQTDLLKVTGHADLAGTLRLEKVNGARLKVGSKVQFVSAAGGVNGQFSTVENAFDTGTMIKGTVVYDTNGVSLVGTQGLYGNMRELTPNQVTVARNVDKVADDPRAKKLLDFLNNQQLSKIPQDLDRIAPEELASVYRIGFSIADVHAQNLQRRTADIRAGSSGFSAAGFQTSGSGPNYSGPMGAHGATGTEAAGKSTVVQAPPDDKWGVFITGTGDFVNVGDSENARGYNMETGGMTVGVDYKVTPHFAVGVNAGYASTSADLANEGRARVVGAKGGVYGTYSQGRFYVDAAVNGGYNSYETNRSALKGTARGSTDGGEFDAMIGTGYDFKFGDLTIGPTATFQYTYVGIDGFTERGSLAPLAYGDQNADSFRSALGFRASYDWQVGGVVVRPEIRAAWQHEFGDRGYSIDSRFASGAGNTFSVTDTEIGRDGFLLGAGVAVLWNPRTSTYIYYDGDVGRKDFDSHNVSGGMRLSF